MLNFASYPLCRVAGRCCDKKNERKSLKQSAEKGLCRSHLKYGIIAGEWFTRNLEAEFTSRFIDSFASLIESRVISA
jgi:hypothetical protein